MIDETWSYSRAPNEKGLLLEIVNSEALQGFQAILFLLLDSDADQGRVIKAVLQATSQLMAAHGRMLGLEHVSGFLRPMRVPHVTLICSVRPAHCHL